MKKELILVILLLFPLVSAANIEYTIVDQKTLVEIEMSPEEAEIFEFPKDFEISEGKLKYIDKEMVERGHGHYFFITQSSILPNSSVKLTLPEGAFLEEEHFVFPKDYRLETNGQNIVLVWVNSGEEEIFVPYQEKRSNLFWILIPFGLIALGYFLYNLNKSKTKKYTQNLFREEKLIMNYLLKKKECWTKEIVKDLEIPKVRLSRKMRRLEERGLIERIPYGNENKVKLKK